VTELVARKRAEVAARAAAAAAVAATDAKSQFLARMSHEIRTPLNGMIAVGQLLAETALSPAQWDLVNTVRCSGEALLTLVTDILDFSRAEADRVALTPSEFAVGGAVEAAVDIAGSLAARKRLRVAYAVSSSVPPILVADAARLQQVLLNVLNNAVKFTEAGCVLLEVWADGTPRAGGRRPPQPLPAAAAAATALLGDDACTTTTTTTTPAWPGAASWPAPEASAAARPPLPPPPPGAVRLRFSVRDTGIGIAPADVPRLFQSFMQVGAERGRGRGWGSAGWSGRLPADTPSSLL
jgi:signal transduction histidine kinase